MKKYLVVCAAAVMLLPCFPLLSQEADGTGTGAGLTVVPRLDLNGTFPSEDGNSFFNLGNSSLYSLFEGDITPWLSFSVCNHWLSSSPAELYAIEGEGANLFRSDWVNWLDWANVTASFGSFSLTLGKDQMTTGSFEFDEYDWDVHPMLMSGLWNSLCCYQWGGKLSWASESENTLLSLQYTSSPYFERPFGEGFFLSSTLSLEWRGEYGPYRNIWSATAFPDALNGGARDALLLCLGNRWDAGDFTFGLDWYSRSGDEESVLLGGSTFLASIDYSPSDALQFTLKGGLEKARELILGSDGAGMLTASERLGDNWFFGAAAGWFPAENLRLHLAGGYNSFYGTATVSLGALYYFNFSLGK